VYRGIAHIKSIEVEGDVQFIEELEVEVKKNHMKFLNIFSICKEILKTKEGYIRKQLKNS
jgi:hypothetical protein